MIRPGDERSCRQSVLSSLYQEEQQQPDRQRDQEIDSRSTDPRDERKPKHPEGDRNNADIQSDQRKDPKKSSVWSWGLDRYSHFAIERDPGRGHHPHDVGLSMNPRIGNRQRGLAKMRHGGCWIGGKSPVGVVHLYLGDRHQVWPIVEHGRDNTVRAQFDTLERELLHRRVTLAHYRLDGP